MDDASEAVALVIETEYIGQLQSDDRWTDDEIREVQRWIKAARKEH